MTADHETSERVYLALKGDLLSGVFGAGRLQITLLEGRYAASATPVREALMRMVGERLIEMRSTGGFGVASLAEGEVRDLYETNLRLMLLAVAWRRSANVVDHVSASAGRDLDPPVDVLFEGLGRAAGSPAFSAIIDSINDRMCRVRRAEQIELDGLGREFTNLAMLVRSGPGDKLRRALRSYHRRRIKHAVEIARRITLQDAERLQPQA